MKKFEYKHAFIGNSIARPTVDQILTEEWGSEGWEFTGRAFDASAGVEYLMKREIVEEEHPLKDSIIHFFYEGFENQPLCKEPPTVAWAGFDATATGKICPDCQDRLGRKID